MFCSGSFASEFVLYWKVNPISDPRGLCERLTLTTVTTSLSTPANSATDLKTAALGTIANTPQQPR